MIASDVLEEVWFIKTSKDDKEKFNTMPVDKTSKTRRRIDDHRNASSSFTPPLPALDDLLLPLHFLLCTDLVDLALALPQLHQADEQI